MTESSVPREKLSALIITFNEINYIERCIDSISFADEIIVVDSYSTDGTYEYLQGHPKVRAIQNPFENFTAQKSFALKQATNDWILFVDADEVVGEKLQQEIIEAINNPNAFGAYWFYRKFMFKNEPLHFSGWQTDKNHRLFRKSKARFTNKKIVHETLEVDGASGVFKERLMHFCYKNYTDYKIKMLRYAGLRAVEEIDNDRPFNYAKLVFKPAWKFLYNYLFRLGFLDFNRGLVICYLNALSVYKRYVDLRHLERLNKSSACERIGQKSKLFLQKSN